ncbi:RND family transporter [Chloroflexota bacterium]
MKRIANFVYDHSRLIIALVIVVNLVSLTSFIRFKLDTDFLSFFTEGNPKAEEYNQLNEKYESGETISILIEGDSHILEKENLQNIYQIQQELQSIDGIAQIQGLLPSAVTSATGIILIDEAYIEDHYTEFRYFMENRYFLTEQLLSDDGQSAVITISLELDAPAEEVIDSLQELADGSPLELSFAGNEVIKDTIKSYLIRILSILPPCAALGILTTFYFVLRNRRLTIMAMIPAIFSALWTFGTLFWSGQELNLISVISPLFIIVVGSAYGLHFVSHYMDNVKKYDDHREVIVATMDMVGTPILMATITTMAGFISLVWTDVVPMRQMGIFVTLGIGYAGLIALFFVPAVLSKFKLSGRQSGSEGSWLSNLVLKVSRQKALIFALFIAIVVISAFFIPKLHVVSNQLMFFREGSEIRETFARVEEHSGGAMPLIGEIISTEGQSVLLNYDYAIKVLETERQLEDIPGIKSAFSAFDMLKGMNKMATGEDVYPANPALIQGMLSQPGSNDLSAFVSEDGLRMLVRTEGITSEDIDELEIFVAEHSDTIRVITGMPVLFDEMNSLIVKSQVQSMALAMVLIFIMLWITLRRFTAALAGLLPVAITICAIMGMLAITGFQLNIMTANLSAITIGVGVDYSIHVISGIFYHRKQGMSQRESVNATLPTVSRPVIANAFGLAIGFSAFFFSPLAIHVQVASVMWVAMVVSSMAALLLLPIFYSGRQKK